MQINQRWLYGYDFEARTFSIFGLLDGFYSLVISRRFHKTSVHFSKYHSGNIILDGWNLFTFFLLLSHLQISIIIG